jgi:hypothetical protein
MYFAVQTRKQEVVEKRLAEAERVSARKRLSKSEKELSGEASCAMKLVTAETMKRLPYTCA